MTELSMINKIYIPNIYVGKNYVVSYNVQTIIFCNEKIMKRRRQKTLNKKVRRVINVMHVELHSHYSKNTKNMFMTTWNAKRFYLTAVNFVNMWDMTLLDFRNISSANLVVNSSIRKNK